MHDAIAEGSARAGRAGAEERRCAYVIGTADGGAQPRFCSAVCYSRSAYCPEHHARCRLRGGSLGERQRLREIEALATAVGGKRARADGQPSALTLRRLERVAQAALTRPVCSCFVQGNDDASNGS